MAMNSLFRTRTLASSDELELELEFIRLLCARRHGLAGLQTGLLRASFQYRRYRPVLGSKSYFIVSGRSSERQGLCLYSVFNIFLHFTKPWTCLRKPTAVDSPARGCVETIERVSEPEGNKNLRDTQFRNQAGCPGQGRSVLHADR